MRYSWIATVLAAFLWAPGVNAGHLSALTEEVVEWCAPFGHTGSVPSICYGYIFAILDLVKDGHAIAPRANERSPVLCAKGSIEEVISIDDSITMIRDLINAEVERENQSHTDHIVYDNGHDFIIDLMLKNDLAILQPCDEASASGN